MLFFRILPAAVLLLPLSSAPVMAADSTAAGWYGCYAGLQAGLGLTKGSFSYIENANVLEDTFFSLGSDTANGLIAGGQIGCDIQMNNMVIGVQGMLASAKYAGTSGYVVGLDEVGFDWNATGEVRFESSWISSVTGRIGYVVSEPTLAYLKAGYAQMHVDLTDSGNFVDNDDAGNNAPYSYSGEDTRAGYTLGLGLEHRVTDHLTIFAEYNYYDFGKTEISLTESDFGYDYDNAADLEVNAFQLGINLRF